MTHRTRTTVLVFLLLLLVPLAVSGLTRLPAFGHYQGPYGDVINTITVHARHVTNMVSAVNYDIRGFDTLGEEFLLMSAVTGVAMLLRGGRGEATSARPTRVLRRRREGRSEAITGIGRLLAPITLLYGIYIIVHAQLTPGGGFQGGVIVFAAALLVYFGEGYASWRKTVRSTMLTLGETLGAAIYLCSGLYPLLSGAAFLQNTLPLGQIGTITSGGSIPIINLGVGCAVAAGFCSIALELLEETRLP